MKEKPSITIVIPAYNESATIIETLKNVYENHSINFREIIVIDDCSNDGMINKLNKIKFENLIVLRNPKNLGYGASLKKGVKLSNSEYVLTMDADGQHTSEHLNSIFENYSKYDAVIGSRENFFHSNIYRLPGKLFIKLFSQFLTGEKIPDVNSGLRIVKKSILEKYMHLCPSGFSFSTTITITLLYKNYDIFFTPIKVKKREKGKSSVKISDGFNTILLILRLATQFNPLKVFIPLSIIFFLSGMLVGIPIFLKGEGLSIGSLFLLISSLLFFSIGLLFDQISQMRLERFE